MSEQIANIVPVASACANSGLNGVLMTSQDRQGRYGGDIYDRMPLPFVFVGKLPEETRQNKRLYILGTIVNR